MDGPCTAFGPASILGLELADGLVRITSRARSKVKQSSSDYIKACSCTDADHDAVFGQFFPFFQQLQQMRRQHRHRGNLDFLVDQEAVAISDDEYWGLYYELQSLLHPEDTPVMQHFTKPQIQQRNMQSQLAERELVKLMNLSYNHQRRENLKQQQFCRLHCNFCSNGAVLPAAAEAVAHCKVCRKLRLQQLQNEETSAKHNTPRSIDCPLYDDGLVKLTNSKYYAKLAAGYSQDMAALLLPNAGVQQSRCFMYAAVPCGGVAWCWLRCRWWLEKHSCSLKYVAYKEALHHGR